MSGRDRIVSVVPGRDICPRINGLTPRQLGLAAEVRYARRDGLLVDRHRLPDDDAQGRPGWDDLDHFEAAAL